MFCTRPPICSGALSWLARKGAPHWLSKPDCQCVLSSIQLYHDVHISTTALWVSNRSRNYLCFLICLPSFCSGHTTDWSHLTTEINRPCLWCFTCLWTRTTCSEKHSQYTVRNKLTHVLHDFNTLLSSFMLTQLLSICKHSLLSGNQWIALQSYLI